MSTTFKRIIIVAIALIVAAGVACGAVLSGGCSTTGEDSTVDGVRNGAVNTVIDLSGIKGRIDSELREKATEAASQFGVSESTVNGFVDELAIEDWQATTLPSDAVETGTYPIETDGVSALITTYDDPSIVTVQAYGQSLTMAVPDSAQGYISMIRYLEYLQ